MLKYPGCQSRDNDSIDTDNLLLGKCTVMDYCLYLLKHPQIRC